MIITKDALFIIEGVGLKVTLKHKTQFDKPMNDSFPGIHENDAL